jgi:hypothetical protein
VTASLYSPESSRQKHPGGGEGGCTAAGSAGSPPRRDRRPARGERGTRRQGKLRSGGDSAHRRGMSSSPPPQQHLIATPSEPVHERERDGIGDSERSRTAVPHGLATQAGERTERLSRLVSPLPDDRAQEWMLGVKGLVHFPSQPKIFPLPPITSNLSTYAWSIKCR